jgi:threonine/homoserine/homoserine lactone efflux protein
MVDSQLAAFCLLALALTLTPGADTALVTKNLVARGRRAAMYTTFGICLGCAVHAVASSLGLSVILAKSAAAFEAVKLVGAGYLIWIGIRTLRAAIRHADDSAAREAEARTTGHRWRAGLFEGFATNLLNPKVALFYLLALPQFIAPGQNVLARSLTLAGIHIGMGLIWLSLYAAMLDRLKGVLRRGGFRRWFEGALGVILILLGGRLAVERRGVVGQG